MRTGLLIMVLCVATCFLFGLAITIFPVEQPKPETPTVTVKKSPQQMNCTLTVNYGQKSEGGVCYPYTASGIPIFFCYERKCCACSVDILRELKLKMLDSIYVDSDYSILDGWYLIVDKNNTENKTIELICRKTNDFKLQFCIDNQIIKSPK